VHIFWGTGTTLDKEHVLRRNWTKFVLDWRHFQGYHWTHLHNKECDCIIVTNKTKLTHLHPYKTTVVYKLWWLSVKLNFVKWYLQRVHAGEVNLMLVLFSDEAWFHHSWYVWPLKITLTVMLIYWCPYMKLKFGVRCVISATRIIGAILFSQTINSHQKLTYSDTIWFTYLIIQGSVFVNLMFMDLCIVVWLSRNNQQDATL
jgi:hypothetical protein